MQNYFNKGELINFLLRIWVQKTNICVTKTAERLVPLLCKLSMLCLRTDASSSSSITEGSHQLLPFNLLLRREDGQKMIVEVEVEGEGGAASEWREEESGGTGEPGRSSPASVRRGKEGLLEEHFCAVLCNVLCNLWCGSLWEGGMEYIHAGEERFGRISFSLLFSLKNPCG